MEYFSAQGTIPAGSDASKEFFLCGVPAGRILWISAISAWGGDLGDFYEVNLVPSSQQVNNVTIDGAVGMTVLMNELKGGGTAANQTSWPSGLGGMGNMRIAGPVSLLISASAANTAAFSTNIIGHLE